MINQNSACAQCVTLDTTLARVYRMKKGVMTTARLVNDRLKLAPVRWVPLMVTLTYRDIEGWRPDDITKFLRTVGKWAGRRGYTLPYVWVMELQKRGAPHYHVLLWIPARLRLPRSDARGWWPHGSTNTIRVKNAVGYVAKYASKFESKDGAEFPKGARIHGIGGLTQHEKRVVAWWKLPKDLRQGEEGSCRYQRAKGGGWRDVDTGEVIPSEWGLSAVGQGQFSTVRLVRKPQGAAVIPRLYQQEARRLEREVDGALKRRAVDLRDDLGELLETDRIAFLWRIERLARLSPGGATIPRG